MQTETQVLDDRRLCVILSDAVFSENMKEKSLISVGRNAAQMDLGPFRSVCTMKLEIATIYTGKPKKRNSRARVQEKTDVIGGVIDLMTAV